MRWPTSTIGCRSSWPISAWDRWLDTTPEDPAELIGLLVPNEDVELEIYPVSRAVNNVRNDGPDLIRPLVAAT